MPSTGLMRLLICASSIVSPEKALSNVSLEWAEGWQMDFGLFAVDRETQARRLREGA